MEKEYLFNDIMMYPFLKTVSFKYSNSGFAVNDMQMLSEMEFDDLIKDKERMNEGVVNFKDAKYVCCILVTGKDDMNAHYQVLVIRRDERQIFLIEHAKGNPPSSSQRKRVRHVIKSFGWEESPKLTEDRKNANKGN